MQTKSKLEVIFTVILTERAMIHKNSENRKEKGNTGKVNKEHEWATHRRNTNIYKILFLMFNFINY